MFETSAYSYASVFRNTWLVQCKTARFERNALQVHVANLTQQRSTHVPLLKFTQDGIPCDMCVIRYNDLGNLKTLACVCERHGADNASRNSLLGVGVSATLLTLVRPWRNLLWIVLGKFARLNNERMGGGAVCSPIV